MISRGAMSSNRLIALHQRIRTRVPIHSLQAVLARTFTSSGFRQGYYNSYSHTGNNNDRDDKTPSNKPEPTSQKPASSNGSAGSKALDPDTIKGPGGLTMTQIGKLVQQSRARDLEQKALKQQQQQHPAASRGSK
ncbi:hypothetical protein BGZ67_005364 [Mortierella alpina]|nr:hypothetical protein BGZ67_005364 [Mortierella alpina]